MNTTATITMAETIRLSEAILLTKLTEADKAFFRSVFERDSVFIEHWFELSCDTKEQIRYVHVCDALEEFFNYFLNRRIVIADETFDIIIRKLIDNTRYYLKQVKYPYKSQVIRYDKLRIKYIKYKNSTTEQQKQYVNVNLFKRRDPVYTLLINKNNSKLKKIPYELVRMLNTFLL